MGEIHEKSGQIRVLLADDHTMFRQGLAGILASYGGMEVIAEIPNDGETLELARELSPDVVIMQVQMPFERAKQTLRAMRTFSDPPKVVIVTMFESPRYVRGLSGIGSVLSARELEILLLAARGLSNHQISYSLHLAEGTVKRHLANVYQKMGVGSRGEASREALLRDWITIEEITAEDEG